MHTPLRRLHFEFPTPKEFLLFSTAQISVVSPGELGVVQMQVNPGSKLANYLSLSFLNPPIVGVYPSTNSNYAEQKSPKTNQVFHCGFSYTPEVDSVI